MTRNLLSILTLLVLTAANAQAATYYVATSGNNSNPGTQAQPFQTIQKGMDAAQNGDTVLVGNGTYTGFGNRDLDPRGKNFTLQSQGGAANCTINPAGDDWLPIAGRGFQFGAGVTAQMVVDGFTIRRGLAGSLALSVGGGMVMDGVSPTIRNCVFRDCSAAAIDALGVGGAVFVRDGSPTFTNCSFIENHASGFEEPAAGGGIGIQGNSNVTLTGCHFAGNGAASGHVTVGGGVSLASGARATLTACTFNMNVAGSSAIGAGGGIGIIGGQAVLQNCTFSGNNADGPGGSRGGAIYMEGQESTLTLTDCTFNGNVASSGYFAVGGGVDVRGGQAVLQNCTLSGNAANGKLGQAGGVYVVGQNTSLTLTNCTLSSNTARGTEGAAFGGGAVANGKGQLLLVNTLIVNNHATGTTLSKGGGVAAGDSETNIRLVHCVITQNRVRGDGSGGGVIADNNSSISLTNCILYGNRATTGAEHESYVGAVLTPTYCNIGGYPTTPDANHNFGADPRFVRNPSWGADGNPGTGDDDLGDLHLQSGSPCIDTGMVSPANAAPYDKDINNRLVGFAPDLGAYEVGSTLYIVADLYVDKVNGIDLPGRGTPSAPFRTVNMALSRVTAPVGFTVIHVKEGNYGSDRSTITKKVRFVNWGNTGQARIGKQ